jgi:hypothetical protein
MGGLSEAVSVRARQRQVPRRRRGRRNLRGEKERRGGREEA